MRYVSKKIAPEIFGFHHFGRGIVQRVGKIVEFVIAVPFVFERQISVAYASCGCRKLLYRARELPCYQKRYKQRKSYAYYRYDKHLIGQHPYRKTVFVYRCGNVQIHGAAVVSYHFTAVN